MSDFRKGSTGTTEGDVQYDYYIEQFKSLIERHRVEDVILVRVLTDYYQLVANVAKAGQTSKAKRQLLALSRDIELPVDYELRLSTSIAVLPVWALIHWLEGEAAAAIHRLDGALECGHRLAETYGHGYLTSRRIYIGVNMSRVLISMGDHKAASRLLEALNAVVAGDRDQWPFPGPDSLTVPLVGIHRSLIRWHLDRARALTNEAGQQPVSRSRS